MNFRGVLGFQGVQLDLNEVLEAKGVLEIIRANIRGCKQCLETMEVEVSVL